MNSDELRRRIDPNGTHIVSAHAMVDDGQTVRCTWLVKRLGSEEPLSIELDVELERFNRLDTFTSEEEEVELFG